VEKKDLTILTIKLKDNEYYYTMDYDMDNDELVFEQLSESQIEDLISLIEKIMYYLKEFGFPAYCYYTEGE
jgi:ABC-type uncharacterized transport system substrate-binding protein